MTPGPPSAADLGLMQGAPPFPPQRLISLENWQEPPYNRWAFQHVRELIPTARIDRGDGPVWELPRRERDIDGLRLPMHGRRVSLPRFLEETFTDGFLVLRDGHVVTERYMNGMAPATTHLLMSVSKSVTSVVCGALVEQGLLSPADPLERHIPELAGTAWDGCTVRHLLDMRAGTRFNEDYDDLTADVRVYEQIYLWRPRERKHLPADITAYMTTLENQGPHGGPFDYRSILTDMLAWIIERAAGERLPELIARELWRPMGAEFDAEITVDGRGNAMADGGVCTTLRDLARFGQLLADGGRRGDGQAIPEAWIRDTLTPDPDSVEAFSAYADRFEKRHGAYYRNQFWVVDPDIPIYMGSGINGQNVFVHGEAGVVIAMFSTWPGAWEDRIARDTRNGLIAIAEQLAQTPSD
jgi:CubicO group peptidase (beta-lactamase class C family)